jgi:putative transposase
VIARRPNHVWGIDLTTVSTARGFWVPWLPEAILPVWPFAWWLAVVVDHFSRRVLALGVFRKQPSAEDVRALLERARHRAGVAPNYTVTDHGVQFQSVFRAWCARWSVQPRFGAIGRYGSIAIVERFWRSLKHEAFGFCFRVPPLGSSQMRNACDAYLEWFNQERPHQGLAGRTPKEVFDRARPAHRRPRLEPRARYPDAARSAKPHARVRGKPGVKFDLVLSRPADAPHLPIVRLRKAA